MASAPIDIVKNEVKRTCNQFCKYAPNYKPTSSMATNQSSYISLSYDNGSTNAVEYNGQSYTVDQMRLYFPSLHSFNGKRVAGEFLIIHTPVMGGNTLIVSVPILPTGVQSKSAMMIAKVVQDVSKKAPNAGETTQVFPKLDLSKLLPQAPFFSYTGTLPYQPFNGVVNFVVFNPLNGGFDVDPSVLNHLKGVLSPNNVALVVREKRDYEGNVFYNSDGPVVQSGGDNMIIDCQPVDASGEIVVPDNGDGDGGGDGSDGSNIDIGAFFKSDTGIILLSILFGILFFAAIAAVAHFSFIAIGRRWANSTPLAAKG